MTLFLCGFMGCGKTTTGKLLAKKLGLAYIDMDEYIVQQEKRSIPEIFDESGEEYFRQRETKAIAELSIKNAVISCGGGAMINPVNAEIANKNGISVFLDVPFEVCYSRICGDENRPVVRNNTKEQLEDIYNTRYELYSRHSALKIDADGSPEEISEKITDALRK
ncbi:MAG: shikimate kinase [Oscillospiraceae bacterium]